MIAERRRSPGDRGDLLSMLLMAQDEEDGGRGMSDQQVRDEAMTIFLAGHETTANALAWTWYLLSQAPEVERAMHEEIDRVLGGRLPTMEDIPSLPYVEKVVTESMRLYPPAWIIGRRALEDYPIDGYVVPARSVVVISPYLIHRDARFFPEPDRFVPERWTPEFKASLPPFAYFPFGGGARRCIGESFAWMELCSSRARSPSTGGCGSSGASGRPSAGRDAADEARFADDPRAQARGVKLQPRERAKGREKKGPRQVGSHETSVCAQK